MGRYAEGTKVSVSQSRDEIERTLERFGADQFVYGQKSDGAVIGFTARDRQVKFYLPLVELSDQEKRQRWRALAMVDWFEEIHGLPFHGTLIEWDLPCSP